MNIEVAQRPDNTSLMDGIDSTEIESDPLRGLIEAVSAVYTGGSVVDAAVADTPPIENVREVLTNG